MYGSQEDGSIDEDALSSILKTALGVAELAVTDLFRAIDQEGKGKITFGECLGAGTVDSHLCRGDPRRGDMHAVPAPRASGSTEILGKVHPEPPPGKVAAPDLTSLGGDTSLGMGGSEPQRALSWGPDQGLVRELTHLPGALAAGSSSGRLWLCNLQPHKQDSPDPRGLGPGARRSRVGAPRVPGGLLLGAPPSEHVSK